MKILHYCLGFSPYRSGGLTVYAEALIANQSLNNKIYVMWPGEIRSFNSKKCFLRIRNKTLKNKNVVKSVELINPLPVSLTYGYSDTALFMQSKNEECFKKFLSKEEIDVIHIHTLMGLPIEFLRACKNLHIKIVFTTHDLYGICPKSNLFNGESICKTFKSMIQCSDCCIKSLSKLDYRIMQHPIYRCFKTSKLFKKIANLRKQNISTCTQAIGNDESKAINYIALREYYLSMLDCMDLIAYNSELTKKIFGEFFVSKKSIIIPLSLPINNKISSISSDKEQTGISIGFIGSFSEQKGFYKLIDSLDAVSDSIQLHVIGKPPIKRDYIVSHCSFSRENMFQFYENCNLVVVPSKGYETFGFGVIESLAYGKPVIATKTVGSSRYIENDFGFVCDYNDLKKTINYVITTPGLLSDMSKKIRNSFVYLDFDIHLKQIYNLYK